VAEEEIQMMYLVTIESEDGSWFEDPEAFDTRGEAMGYANLFPAKADMPPGVCAVIYECRQLTEVTQSP
jgi:hypothetical protein